ncbi:MAG: hypothetical protein ACJAS9_000484 [Polaribacter sp.]|jgi:hypothetical protein
MTIKTNKFIICCIALATNYGGAVAKENTLFCIQNSKSNITYFQAKKLSEKSRIKAFCSLSYLGDHRAQYQIAKFLKNKNKALMLEGYVWAKTANVWFKERRKEKLIAFYQEHLLEEQYSNYESLFNRITNKISSISQIDSLSTNKKRSNKRKPIGSNIKRTEEYIRKNKL